MTRLRAWGGILRWCRIGLMGVLATLTCCVAACGKGSPAAPSVNPGPPPVAGPSPTPSPPAEPAPTPPPPVVTLGVTKVLAFGDSLTEGVFSAPVPETLGRLPFVFVDIPQSYPSKLKAQLVTRYTTQTFDVWNAGKAGERAEQAPPRFIDALRGAEPEVVLLMEGANDLALFGRRGIPRAIGAIETMIKEANRRGLQVFLATLPPARPGTPKGEIAVDLLEFNAELVKTAADEGARLVDLAPAITLGDIGVDGLHPTEAGYNHIAGVFLEALARAYQRTAETSSPTPQ